MENNIANLKHLALIMDGNDRWSKLNGKARKEGHAAGAENAFRIIKLVRKMGIKHLSLFAFSSENWNRPQEEINDIINLFGHYAITKLEEIKENGINVKFVGDLSKFPKILQDSLNKVSNVSQNNTNMFLYIVIGYGGKAEIVNAARKIVKNKMPMELITEQTFAQDLYCPEMPDVDFLIRTSDRKCISNFLLWQSAYAELYFAEKLWPDFGEEDLNIAIRDYNTRKRNFGGRINE